ncbi:MAG TPA: glycoside hydrolase family 3 C-terminal domain-containing protein [Lentimicrobium sp.]|nr:glycoside hydrolase family 3 C-terminal domain-containing protein [Lentimicrobium sp.]
MKNLKSLFLLLIIASICACNKSFIYKDKDAKIDDRVEDLLKQMTLDEKIAQLVGDSATGFDTKTNERLGIPGLKMTDGPIGVRWNRATSFPSGVSLGATWDTALTQRYAQALAKETLAKGRNMLLGPCVNIHRFPAGGRNFESYGEDPYLTQRLAVSYIKALQQNGVIATIKHYALNNQEWRRTEVNVQADERTMREIYLPSFEYAVKEAGVYTVMSSYNKVNGWWASENEVLLNKILKEEWGFRGLVVSDWVSTHNTVNAAKYGLDIEMPFAQVWTAEKLKAAIKSGEITEDIINEKVRRILRVKFEAGLFDQDQNMEPDTSVLHGNEHKQLALEMALKSMVLLKNEKNLLPVDLSKTRKIAVIGPLAKNTPTGGGGSSHVTPYYTVDALDGITGFVKGQAEVLYAPGSVTPITPIYPVPAEFLSFDAQHGLQAEFFNNMGLTGQPVLSRIDQVIDFEWNDKSPTQGIGRDKYSIRWTGFITAPETREFTFYTASDDGVRLFIDNKLIIDNWTDHGTTIDSARYSMIKGKKYAIKVEYFENGGSETIQLGWNYKVSKEREALLAEAVNIAKQADIAILFVGTTDYIESESFDRTGGLDLLAGQNELISAVAAANPRTIVVMYSGTPVIADKWLNKVPAMIQAFFPGQEGGNAIPKLIFGEENFEGKLPFSYIASYDQTPAYEGYADSSLVAPYKEGIYVGYRWLEKNKIQPNFPFGFGLSYTSFDYSNLKINKKGDFQYDVTLDIKNSGKMRGTEVVELYIAPQSPATDRPVKELKGFTKVELRPGEQRTVTMTLNKRSFCRYDTSKKDWIADPGKYGVLIGASSADVKLTGEIIL